MMQLKDASIDELVMELADRAPSLLLAYEGCDPCQGPEKKETGWGYLKGEKILVLGCLSRIVDAMMSAEILSLQNSGHPFTLKNCRGVL